MVKKNLLILLPLGTFPHAPIHQDIHYINEIVVRVSAVNMNRLLQNAKYNKIQYININLC